MLVGFKFKESDSSNADNERIEVESETKGLAPAKENSFFFFISEKKMSVKFGNFT